VFAPEQAIVFYNDSLDALSGIPALRDSVDRRVEIMERLGDLYTVNGELERAVEEYHATLDLVDDVKHKARFYTKAANAYHGIGDKDKCIIESDKGLELLGDEDSRERASLLGSKSWSYIVSGEFDEAIRLLEESLRISEKLEDKAAIARANHRIGTCYARMGETSEGLRFLNKALHSRQQMGDEVGAALSRVNIGMIYDDIGEFQKAMDYYLTALETFKKMKDKYHIALITNNIGVAYEGQGELDLALEYYMEGRALAGKIGDKVSIANVNNNIAVILYLKDKPLEALEYYTTALELGNDLGSTYLIQHVMRGIANCQIMVGRLEEARENILKALEISIEIGVKVEEAENHCVLGVVYRENGQLEKALEAFEQSRMITEETGIEDKLARLLLEYAKYHTILGENAKARQELERALSIFESKNMKRWADKCRKELDELDPV